ncbi:sugar ABC transporter ATP-binding protein [Sediminispirochaeta smaragdinae]|jgi:simple sugar transport system ATP-binding protein|uniref:ABC transporter related protein n=1 Tax=Sediminispirochaeta smaragdinae (strain DSM 11293 / JCM 15392 / SEBR 4228) TaxID=573413 RepID=E1R2E9_SEDSS|nr:sugar ABC transporter ATP-binding protein [Sediminispirochaeta smaragdinae]ADK82509.1 ABC transporter related protein [Sediminispirochaeta smaragdinae DSM 11293]
MEEKNILEMRHISKAFPGVKALNDVDFFLRSGEIHALMGENGAGKSTLIKVLTGVYVMDDGEIRVSGFDRPVVNHSPEEAQRNGISTVYQEINLCPNITVAENLFVGRQPLTTFGAVNWKEMNKRASRALEIVGVDIDATKPLADYSVAIQQMVAIARAVDFQCKVLILDEPTSSLDDNEVKKLFTVMRNLKDHGVGVVFVTHFLDQVYEVCDRITVLRNGELVGQYPVAELPRVQLVAKMLGRDFDDLAEIRSVKTETGEASSDETTMVHAVGLSRSGMIKPFDIDIKKGEVIGLAGLLGSGRSELARLLYCAERPEKGELFVKGRSLRAHAPIDSMRAGMAFLPEDRKEEGVIGDLSVRENLIIALQAKTGIFRLLPLAKQNELADRYIRLLNIKTPSPETLVKQLSGGNQQKVILGRWLITNPEFLILDEPTRGIDVGTKTEIQKLIIKLAEEGVTVLFISSEIEEMLRTVNRLYILCDRQKTGELANDDLSQNEVMAAIAGGTCS